MKELILAFVTVLLLLSSQNLKAQGQLWGTTVTGGTNNIGVIFKTNGDGTGYSVQKSFSGNSTGSNPQGDLTLASDGKLYGLTSSGGANNVGVIFEYDPIANSYLKRFDFSLNSTGYSPGGNLIQAANGKLYGMTGFGGQNGSGTIFEFDPTNNAFAKKFDFLLSSRGGALYGSLVQAANGKLYGMTTFGGSYNNGVLFEFDPLNGNYVEKFEFISASSGGRPFGSLMQASNGMLYGMTSQGGRSNSGTLFEFNPLNGVFFKRHDFSGSEFSPRGSLVQASNGKLYGLAYNLFEFDPSNGNFVVKVNNLGTGGFIFSNSYNNLLKSTNGRLYGVVPNGGANSLGYIFEFNPDDGTYSKRYDFDIPNRVAFAKGGLAQATNGKLYGMTNSGGTNGVGVLYEFNPANGIVAKRFNFLGFTNGANLYGGLIKSSNGKFFGMTFSGGANDDGTIFEYDPLNGSFIKRFDFDYYTNGSNPYGSLVQAANGKLYGLCSFNKGGYGIIFEYDPINSIFSKKYSFDVINGADPAVNLVLASNGKLYGMTQNGGANGNGVLFEYDPSNSVFVKKIDFTSFSSGARPSGSLTQVMDGKIYGCTTYGGTNNSGVLFEFDPSTGILSKKFDFIPAVSGSFPEGRLVETPSGKLYGMTNSGGANNAGTIFEFNPTSGDFNKKFDFSQAISGAFARGSLTLNPNGKLYGMVPSGGTNGLGTFFEFDPLNGNFVKKLDFDGTNGGRPWHGDVIFVTDNQTITFNSLPSKTIGDTPFALSATASSGLPVSYISDNPLVATISGSTATIVGAGTANITASQGGSGYYNPAPPVSQALVVKQNQTITFAAIPDKTLGDASFTLSATASSALPVTYTSASDKVSINGNQVTLLKAGRVTIIANQAGNANFSAATPVEQIFCIKPVKPTVTISNANSEAPTLASSATSGNQWYLNGAAIITGTGVTLSVTAAGVYKVQASAENCTSAFSADFPIIITGDLPQTSSIEVCISPNPVEGFVEVYGLQGELSGWALFDMSGRTATLAFEKSDNLYFAPVRHLSKGMYVLRLQQENKIYQLKFVKN